MYCEKMCRGHRESRELDFVEARKKREILFIYRSSFWVLVDMAKEEEQET